MKKMLLMGSLVAAVALTVLLPGAFAAAQDGTDPYVSQTPTVADATSIPPASDAAAPSAAEQASAQQQGTTGEVASSNLAFTGGDVAAVAGLGLAALAIGFGLLVLRNRHRTSDTPA